VKTGFNQRRKMLRNSLKPLLSEESRLPDHPLLNQRPEQLSIAQFETLANLLEPITKDFSSRDKRTDSFTD